VSEQALIVAQSVTEKIGRFSSRRRRSWNGLRWRSRVFGKLYRHALQREDSLYVSPKRRNPRNAGVSSLNQVMVQGQIKMVMNTRKATKLCE
jgi:hypothetical protein